MTPDVQDDHFLTAEQLCQRYGGVSKMWIRRRISDSAFPNFVRFGRMRFWSAQAVSDWERQQAEKSRPTQPVAQKRKHAA